MRWLLLGLAACSFKPIAATGTDGSMDVQNHDDGSSALQRIALTFHNAQRTPLAEFPVLVVLEPTRVDYSQFAPGGADVRFYDPDGTALAYEIEDWSPGARSFVWVRVPLIDASDTDYIWMEYGDPDAVDHQDPAGVWSADHVGVWHLANDPANGVGVIRDSTANAHHGVPDASMTSSDLVAGVVGTALQFSGATARVITAASSAYTLPIYTWSMWLRGDTAPTTGGGLGNLDAISNGDVGFNFAWDHNLTAFTDAAAQNDGTNWTSVRVGTALSGAVWYHVAATFDGSMLCAYRDGVASGCVAAATPAAPNGTLSIGGPNSGLGTFPGTIDEVRVSSVVRSGDWIDAEHATEIDSSTTPFVVFGSPQPTS